MSHVPPQFKCLSWIGVGDKVVKCKKVLHHEGPHRAKGWLWWFDEKGVIHKAQKKGQK